VTFTTIVRAIVGEKLYGSGAESSMNTSPARRKQGTRTWTLPIDADKKIPVLFIGGWGRSGSTLLGSILGQLPGFTYVGELSNVWTRGVVENSPCGCGARFRECEMWRAVFDQAFGGIDEALARRMMAARQTWPNNKALLLRGLVGRSFQVATGPEPTEYAARLRSLYAAISKYTNGAVIVDSSKTPSYAYALGSQPNIALSLVHLVRDPRATTYSWLRRIQRSDAGRTMSMERLAVWQSAAQWTTWNATTAVVADRLSIPLIPLTYESFVENPRAAVESVLAFLKGAGGSSAQKLPFVSSHSVELRPTHNVWGNPRRQRVGRVDIVADNEWSLHLSKVSRALTIGLTYPLARRYGYFE
jgi:hypothetical protein